MRFATRLLVAFAVAAVSTLAASADTFSYTFTDTNQSQATFFDYTGPVLITTDTTFVPTTCEVFGVACTSADILPSIAEIDIISTSPFREDSFLDFPASFLTVGTHDLAGFTMTITDNSSSSTVPEPSTLLLLGTGLLALAGATRLRFLGA